MKDTIDLNTTQDTKQIEKAGQTSFLIDLLGQMGVPIVDLFEGDIDLNDVTQRMKLRKVLLDYNVQVIDDNDGGMKVFVDQELIGEWYKCTYILKRDHSKLDPKKQLYLQMAVNYWSIFEEN